MGTTERYGVRRDLEDDNKTLISKFRMDPQDREVHIMHECRTTAGGVR